MSGPWREPREESADLYPGLVVHDGRVSGSITLGQSRLPIWCLAWDVSLETTGHEYARDDYKVSEADLMRFLNLLFDLRGEFARLLLVLADAERCDRGGRTPPWWETKRHRKRVGDQLRRCLDALEPKAAGPERGEAPINESDSASSGASGGTG